jgi:simple sugar transport system substrate-binding protein
VVVVDVQDRVGTRQRLADVIRSEQIDGVLALNAEGAEAALDAVRSAKRPEPVHVATFDLSPEVLAAIRARRIDFAVDQQAYLQGYLPIVLLTQRLRYGLFAAEGEVVATGPTYVTRANADQATLLSERGIR